MPICKHCNQTFPNRIIVNDNVVNTQRRKFCLTCSPFGKHNTKSSLTEKTKSTNCVCEICNKDFVSTGVWKRCNYCSVKLRRCRIKLAGVALLGGRCQECGWNKNPYVLEFHHDDNNKEFTISTVMNTSWEKIKKEIEKCTLLCANCHRTLHTTRFDDKFHAIVLDYDGDLDISLFQ